MNDGEKTNLVERPREGSSIIVILFLIVLVVSIGAAYYRVYVQHTINFFVTDEDINRAQPWVSSYGN